MYHMYLNFKNIFKNSFITLLLSSNLLYLNYINADENKEESVYDSDHVKSDHGFKIKPYFGFSLGIATPPFWDINAGSGRSISFKPSLMVEGKLGANVYPSMNIDISLTYQHSYKMSHKLPSLYTELNNIKDGDQNIGEKLVKALFNNKDGVINDQTKSMIFVALKDKLEEAISKEFDPSAEEINKLLPKDTKMNFELPDFKITSLVSTANVTYEFMQNRKIRPSLIIGFGFTRIHNEFKKTNIILDIPNSSNRILTDKEELTFLKLLGMNGSAIGFNDLTLENENNVGVVRVKEKTRYYFTTQIGCGAVYDLNDYLSFDLSLKFQLLHGFQLEYQMINIDNDKKMINYKDITTPARTMVFGEVGLGASFSF